MYSQGRTYVIQDYKFFAKKVRSNWLVVLMIIIIIYLFIYFFW